MEIFQLWILLVPQEDRYVLLNSWIFLSRSVSWNKDISPLSLTIFTICYFKLPKKLSRPKELRSIQSTIDDFFLLSWGHCVSGITKLEIGLRNSILEFVQNFAKNSFPQVSQFFSVCLVCPTYSHCWPHWTWRGSRKGAPLKTSQELRMLSSVTINCQITKIVMNSGSQLSVL